MKAVAFILALIWGLLMIEPAFANFNCKPVTSSSAKNKSAQSPCTKNKPAQSSCSRSKCNKSKQQEDENDCENNRCNPLMSCPTGNFYLFGHSFFSIPALIISKQKNILVNDNRVVKQLTECWHPPEII